MFNLGDTLPNFQAETTIGTINLYDYLGDSWGILFSHPSDFTPVCTTELARVLTLMPEFDKRGVKVLALSCDSVDSHCKWIEDIQAVAGSSGEFPYPIIADEDRELAVLLGMLDPVEKDRDGLPLTCRAVFVIGPDKTLRLAILYPATTGRNFDEILRVIDSLQIVEKHQVATPVDWKAGEMCMVLPSVSDQDAACLFPRGVTVRDVPSGKSYLRMTPAPQP
ncbi:peroxiredoxin-6-like [Bacillus rossius redtenbacheri]|uniref:peroxiredoxin-6-like n=1 Tax=Bacillus rossius redtenbacheri TaxID=93214 RepID=UPI002FDD6A08